MTMVPAFLQPNLFHTHQEDPFINLELKLKYFETLHLHNETQHEHTKVAKLSNFTH